jgi:ferritin
MKTQAKEEQGHAMKMFDFLSDRGAGIILQAIPKPADKFSSPKDVFEQTLEHEQKVTSLINNLYDLANKVDDKAASIFLQWFITEQVEEEKNATEILEKLKIIKADSPAMLILDAQLGKRGE